METLESDQQGCLAASFVEGQRDIAEEHVFHLELMVEQM